MLIRNATSQDFERIVDIYNQAIPHRLATADTEPVSYASREKWFNNHKINNLPIKVLCLDTDQAASAWISLEPFYGRPAYDKTAEVSVYVDENQTKKGLASRLCQDLFGHLKSYNIETVMAFVFAHNDPSIRLFEKFQFETWGHFPQIAEMDDKRYDLKILGRKF